MSQIHDCEQGSPEWLALRAGIPTASNFATIMAKGRDGPSLTRAKYMRQLAGEIITGEPAETYSNGHMARGQEMETQARERYAFDRDVEPRLVGFIRNGPKGASPDALIGDRGALEIKTALPDILIEAMLRDDAPPQHRAQTQGVLWVAEREWIDLVVYWPKLPPVIHRAVRDEAYIASMASAVDAFNDELAALVERIRAYGSPAAARAA